MTIEDESQKVAQPTKEEIELQPEKVEVNQDILRARVEKYRPQAKDYFKRPYLVWTGMPLEFTYDKDLTEQESVPVTFATIQKLADVLGVSANEPLK
ncbi:MAG: hypothetical protein UV01_C0015G0012 [Parcubacteria group bacterium GW2011_GWA2_42_14]|nr:MAG: hypothetical protein UV01_C0015G0012 [Parcubacteria group bacterium GW2011_GWA2_42_14]